MSESEKGVIPQKEGEVPYKVGPGKPPLETRFGGERANPRAENGRPKGSSILAPILRKLAANANEHGEGEEAVKLANRAILGAQSGQDISGVLKLLERTDGAVEKEIKHSGGITLTRVVLAEEESP